MGIYSKQSKKAFLESNLLFEKASEDYYKAKMFYGYAQVYIDANNETEAKVFAARAVNDFDTFCKCYTPDNGDKLNGIVVKPFGETANEFVACSTTIEGNKKFEHIVIREGKIIATNSNVIVKEENEIVNDENLDDTTSDDVPEPNVDDPGEEDVTENVNLARDF